MSGPQDWLEAYRRDAIAVGEADAMQALMQTLETAAPQVWLECAERLLHLEQPVATIELLKTGMQKFTGDVELLYALGSALRLAGDGATAEAVLRQVLAWQPAHQRASLTLALLYRDRGHNSAAAEICVALHGRVGGVELSLYLIDLLRKCRRERDAIAICEAELACSPDHGRLQFTAGGLALTLGRFDDARRWLLAALDRLSPELEALLPLALTHRYTSADDPELARFSSVSNRAELAPSIRAGAAFALGKACDDLGHFERAAASLREANSLRRQQTRWIGADWQQFVERQIAHRGWPALDAPLTDAFTPVFVVGLPRTGTTLVAELLGRHPAVRGRGELPWLGYVARTLDAADPRSITAASLSQAAALYLAQMRQDDAPAQWYVDKNPLNFRYLNLAAALFPNARIVFCERQRRDTALSLWSQSFDSADTGFADDFDDIAQFMQGHDRLIAHWLRTLRLPIHRVRYEALTQTPDAAIGQLAAFIGLPQTDLLQAASPQSSTVNTASVWQVRQPIYTSSVGRAEAYLPFVPELRRF